MVKPRVTQIATDLKQTFKQTSNRDPLFWRRIRVQGIKPQTLLVNHTSEVSHVFCMGGPTIESEEPHLMSGSLLNFPRGFASVG